MKKRVLLIAAFIAGLASFLCSQNTVGLISFDNGNSIGGYNLIYPEKQPNIYLLNECGEIVHIWEDEPGNLPGKTAYLLPNGYLLRSKFDPEQLTGPTIGAGGSGGVVELLTWDNDLLWSYVVMDSLTRQHHDIHPMPNGNVLLFAWEVKSFSEMLENGFNPVVNVQAEYWPEYILEVDPSTNSIVWEWHTWDHLIQDYDSAKANYGIVSEHPELIDINYNEYSSGKKDWMHANAIDYDPVNDHILLSVRNFNEIWIIDHSTTKEEAATHTGGNSGKGGDLLFRWGNPEAYKKGTPADRKLFFQHDAQWVDDFVDTSYEHYGAIVLYNNAIADGLSLGHVLKPVWNAAAQVYEQENGLFLPLDFSATFSHPDTSRNYSTAASSVQIIGNGHVVMCAARQGFAFELSPDGTVVWEYRVPLQQGQPVPQGTLLQLSDNFTFQLERYPENFQAFAGRDLSPVGFIELEPNDSFCMATPVEERAGGRDLQIFPNPASQTFSILKEKKRLLFLEIINQYGQIVFSKEIEDKILEINVSEWPQGIYFIKEKNSTQVFKVVITH